MYFTPAFIVSDKNIIKLSFATLGKNGIRALKVIPEREEIIELIGG